MIGNRLRSPVTLRIDVSDDRTAIRISSHGGSSPAIDRTAISAIEAIATV